MAPSNLPKGWPQDVTYTTKLHYGKVVKPDTLCSSTDLTVTNIVKTAAGPSALVRITPIKDSTHPAFGQSGLFANRHLPPDTFIIFYLGYVHGTGDADETSNYDLSLDSFQDIGIDATNMGNEARFINDYRGIKPSGPNAEFRDCWADLGGGKVERRIGVYVLTAGKSGKRAGGIAKGEEILVSYGKGFWSHRREAEA